MILIDYLRLRWQAATLRERAGAAMVMAGVVFIVAGLVLMATGGPALASCHEVAASQLAWARSHPASAHMALHTIAGRVARGC